MMTYTTKQGDMWDSIAYETMGSTMYTDKLMNANIQLIDYFYFPAGITLVIPERDKVEIPTLPPWKKVNK